MEAYYIVHQPTRLQYRNIESARPLLIITSEGPLTPAKPLILPTVSYYAPMWSCGQHIHHTPAMLPENAFRKCFQKSNGACRAWLTSDHWNSMRLYSNTISQDLAFQAKGSPARVKPLRLLCWFCLPVCPGTDVCLIEFSPSTKEDTQPQATSLPRQCTQRHILSIKLPKYHNSTPSAV